MSALDDHLEPDEHVIYRTGRGWKALLWLLIQSLFIAAWVPILYWAIDYRGPSVFDDYENIILAVLILGTVTLFVLRDVFRTMAVTERRVLKKTGVFTPEIEEMTHTEVTRLSMSWSGWPRSVAVHGPNGREIELHAPLEGHALCRRIAECAQVPTPERLGARIIMAGVVRTALGMAGSLVTASLVFKLLWILLDYGAATDDRPTQIILVLVSLALFMPAIFSLHLGLYLGNVVSMIVLRPTLTASEAKRFFATKWRARRDDMPEVDTRPVGAIFRFGLALKQKLLSRLYGEPIRLDQ